MHAQSILAPDALLSAAHFSDSLFTNAAACSGLEPMISTPTSLNFSCVWGCFRTLSISACSLVTSSRGSLAGANTTYQVVTAYPCLLYTSDAADDLLCVAL